MLISEAELTIFVFYGLSFWVEVMLKLSDEKLGAVLIYKFSLRAKMLVIVVVEDFCNIFNSVIKIQFSVKRKHDIANHVTNRSSGECQLE